MSVFQRFPLDNRDDVEFDEDAYRFQGGGRVGGRLKGALALSGAGIKTMNDLREKAIAQAKKQGKWGMWGNLLGTIAGLAGTAFMPGLGGLLSKGLGKFLAKKGIGSALSYALPKALTKAGITATYKPEEFKSETGFGLDKYEELTDRGTAFRDMGFEQAGTGAIQDVLMAMLPSLTGEGKMGTLGDQLGINPKEVLGYTPTADAAAEAAKHASSAATMRESAGELLREGLFPKEAGVSAMLPGQPSIDQFTRTLNQPQRFKLGFQYPTKESLMQFYQQNPFTFEDLPEWMRFGKPTGGVGQYSGYDIEPSDYR